MYSIDTIKSLCLDPQQSFSSNDPFLHPFLDKGRICASDRYILFVFNPELVEKNDIVTEIKIPPVSRNVSIPFALDELRNFLNSVPKVPEMRTTSVRTQCSECGGSGTVIAEYRSKTGRYYDIETECPVCDGNGSVVIEDEIPTGKSVPSPDALIRLKHGNEEVYFLAQRFEKMLEGLERLGIKECKLISLSSNSQIVFETEGVTAMIARVSPDKKEHIITTIKL